MSSKLSVVHVIPNLTYGGATRGVLELVERLSYEESIDAHLCVLGHSSHMDVAENLRKRLSFLGVENPVTPSFALYRSVMLLRALVGQRDARIVHSHLLPADLVAALATTTLLSRGVRHISHIRDTREWLANTEFASRLKRGMYRAVFRLARTRFVAVSTAAASYAKQAFAIPQDYMTVVLNGVEVGSLVRDLRERRLEGRFVIGSAGRFVTEKRHQDVISALAMLVRDHKNISLRLAGWGSLEDTLREEASRLGLSDRVEVLQNVQPMGPFYKSLDVFVMASSSGEGLPRVVLEAMASGCAVVATRGVGVEDVIEDGVSGILIDARRPDQIANAVAQLMADDSLRRRLAVAGAERVISHFTAGRVARDIAQLYRNDRTPVPDQLCH